MTWIRASQNDTLVGPSKVSAQISNRPPESAQHNKKSKPGSPRCPWIVRWFAKSLKWRHQAWQITCCGHQITSFGNQKRQPCKEMTWKPTSRNRAHISAERKWPTHPKAKKSGSTASHCNASVALMRFIHRPLMVKGSWRMAQGSWLMAKKGEWAQRASFGHEPWDTSLEPCAMDN